MSKYRLVISSSKAAIAIKVCWLALLCLSLWVLKPEVLVHQRWLQTGFTALLLFVGYRWLLQPASLQGIAMLDEAGYWQWLNQSEDELYRLSARSKLGFYCVYLHLTEPATTRASRRFWLFRDQLSEVDFRRVCRIIKRCHNQPIIKGGHDV